MSRYIDADKLIEQFKERHGNRSEYLKIYTLSEIINVIDQQPTADVEEVQYGKWIYEDYHETMGHAFQCSVCMRWMFTNSPEYVVEEYPYCHCGAKIESVKELEEKK